MQASNVRRSGFPCNHHRQLPHVGAQGNKIQRPSALASAARTLKERCYSLETTRGGDIPLQIACRILRRPLNNVGERLEKFVVEYRAVFFKGDERQINQALDQLKILLTGFFFPEQLSAIKTLVSLLDQQNQNPLDPKVFQQIGRWLLIKLAVPAFNEAMGRSPEEAADGICKLYWQLRSLNVFREGKLLISFEEKDEKTVAYFLAEAFYSFAKLPFEEARRALFTQAKNESEGGFALKKLFLEGRLGRSLAIGDPNPFFDLAAFAFFLLESSESIEALKAAEQMDVCFLDHTSLIPSFLQGELVAKLRKRVEGDAKKTKLLEAIIREQDQLLKKVQRGQGLPYSRWEEYELIRKNLYPQVAPVMPVKKNVVAMQPCTPLAPLAREKSPSIREPFDEPLPLEELVVQDEIPPLVEDHKEIALEKEDLSVKTERVVKTWIQKGKREDWPEILMHLSALSDLRSDSSKEDELLELLAVNLTKKNWAPELNQLLKKYLPHLKESYWNHLNKNGAEVYFKRLIFLLSVFNLKMEASYHQSLVKGIVSHLEAWKSKKITSKAGLQAAQLFEELWLQLESKDVTTRLCLLGFLLQPVDSKEADHPSNIRPFISEKMKARLLEDFFSSTKQLGTTEEVMLCIQFFSLINAESNRGAALIKGFGMVFGELTNVLLDLVQSKPSIEEILQKVSIIELFVELGEQLPNLKINLPQFNPIQADFCFLGMQAAIVTHTKMKGPFPSEQVYKFFLKLFETLHLFSLQADDLEKIATKNNFQIFMQYLLTQLDSYANVDKLGKMFIRGIENDLILSPEHYLAETLRQEGFWPLMGSITLVRNLAVIECGKVRQEMIPLKNWEKLFTKIMRVIPYEHWKSHLTILFALAQRHYKLTKDKEERREAKKNLTSSAQALVEYCIKEGGEDDFRFSLEILQTREGLSNKRMPGLLIQLYLASKQNKISEIMRGRLFGCLLKFGFFQQPAYEKEIGLSLSWEEKEMVRVLITLLEGKPLRKREKKGKNSPFVKAALLECFSEVIADHRQIKRCTHTPNFLWKNLISLPQIESLVKSLDNASPISNLDMLIERCQMQYECIELVSGQRSCVEGYKFLSKMILEGHFFENSSILQKLHRALADRLVFDTAMLPRVRVGLTLGIFETHFITHLYDSNPNGYLDEVFQVACNLAHSGDGDNLIPNLLKMFEHMVPYKVLNRLKNELKGLQK